MAKCKVTYEFDDDRDEEELVELIKHKEAWLALREISDRIRQKIRYGDQMWVEDADAQIFLATIRELCDA